MTVRILSDFDGVWTDQALEAEQVKLFLAAEAARLAAVSPDEASRDFERFGRLVRDEPHRFGWAPDGRITAYVDEDPFCEANAVAAWLAAAREDGDERAALYADAILREGFADLTAFADRCFLTATARFREEHPPALVPGAREALEALHDAGAEVVVVSNSESAKIAGWFGQIGVDAGEEEGRLLRVRGRAGKQTLGAGDASIEVAGRRIGVDRPLYRAILEAEEPDLVIGDVFSLDLALPHVLREEGHPAAPSLLVLRRHPHTPAWVLDGRAGGAIDRVVDHPAELADTVRELAEVRR